jgi:hypothetical protein
MKVLRLLSVIKRRPQPCAEEIDCAVEYVDGVVRWRLRRLA